MAFALCSVAFTSCGDDDEGGPTPQGPTTTFAGKLPTQVGSYTFHYDDNGRCTRVSSSYGNVLEIDYKRNIIMTDGEDDYMNRRLHEHNLQQQRIHNKDVWFVELFRRRRI